jgi:serine/threonine-protein kinase
MSVSATQIPDGAPPVSPASVRLELEKILASGRFAASQRQRRFLQFVVEECLDGRGDGIKESVIAFEVFGRDSSFDPRTDSVVRSEARNLRARLNEYYQDEGKQDHVVIKIPKGSYVPNFRAVVAAEGTRSRPLLSIGVAAALGLAIAGTAWWYFFLRPARLGAADLHSVAILPFLNLNASSSEYVADGFVEDLTTELAKLPELRVVARTSVFQYRGRNQDVRKIGRDLGAGALLEGSFREESGRVKVTVQLINSRNGYHLWSEAYDRDSEDVQNLETDIISGISAALGVGRPPKRSPHVPPPEAREAYWRGRYLKANNWEHAGAESIPYFEQAVSADPKFAEAWAALAATHANMAFQLEGNQADQISLAREAAKRALELDDTIAETQLALAGMNYTYDRDWPAAERAFRRALQLNPSYASGHRSFALGLMSRVRFAKAIEHLKLAEQLDPISILSTNNMATTLYCARRYEESIRICRRHLQMDPRFFPALQLIALCETQTGKLAAAISDFEKLRAETGGNIEGLGGQGYAYARAGRLREAATIETELQKIPGGAAGTALAMVYIGRGEVKQAIASLRAAADAHVPDVIFIAADPIFEPLRGNPDFQHLCARLGLPSRP